MVDRTIQNQFDWSCQPEAEACVIDALNRALISCPFLQDFEKKLLAKTSSRLIQWVEAIFLPKSEMDLWILTGYRVEQKEDGLEIARHPGGDLPYAIFYGDENRVVQRKKISIAVEDLTLFLLVNSFSVPFYGSSMGPKRSAIIHDSSDWQIEAVERWGRFSPSPQTLTEQDLVVVKKWLDRFRVRPRVTDGNEEELLTIAEGLIKDAVNEVGPALAASIFLFVEREFWQSKNRAGQIQFARQNSMGLGWANHDHHTFRSSRKFFQKTVHLFELLGFSCRERFWAGKEAGWGAQVLEHKEAKGVIFLDVDLTEHEIDNDFSHTRLPEISDLGTIGLWCALHGESILDAGMHHLEAQFHFSQLESDLKAVGVGMMPPFSFFPYLKQAFTAGERWKVPVHRIEKLLKNSQISQEMAHKFLVDGVIGSHLENLERREGYKGFNKHNVSLIIQRTDPRLQ